MASEHAIAIAAWNYTKPVSNILDSQLELPNRYDGAHLAAVRQAIRERNPDRTEEDFELLFAALNLDRDFEAGTEYTLVSAQIGRHSNVLNADPTGAATRISPPRVRRQPN